MAYEIRGLLFETIAECAALIMTNDSPLKVYRNVKPNGISIDPDVTIGSDPDRPLAVILCTASSSSHNSEIKSWRNLGEIQELKALNTTPPSIINVYFISTIKAGLESLLNKIGVQTIHVEQKPYFSILNLWVQMHLKMSLKSKEQRLTILHESARTSPELYNAINLLASDIDQAIKNETHQLDSLWSLQYHDKARRPVPPAEREGQPVRIRRGLGKLLVADPVVRSIIYSHHLQNKLDSFDRRQIPDYLIELGFFEVRIGRVELTDIEITSTIDLLGAEKCEKLLGLAPKSMELWIDPLRDIKRFDVHADFLNKHYEAITDPNGLRTLLNECYNNPADLSGVRGDEKVWLFDILVTFIKVKSGKFQGFGLAQLEEDIKQIIKADKVEPTRFVIPSFVQRKLMPDPEYMSAIAVSLSKRFSEVSRSEIPRLKENLITWIKKEQLDDRIIPYRNFEPLKWLLEEELKEMNITFEERKPYGGWINDIANLTGTTATTPFLRARNILFHWKSSYGSHVNDKTKELAGRIRNVRYQYDASNSTFSYRQGIDTYVLIVDGDWKNKHLETLTQAGWDKIIYPDEIADFVSQIK